MEFLKCIFQKIFKYILARKKTSKRVKKSVFQENILGYYETQGGFPIEIESQISLLITYSLAISIL